MFSERISPKEIILFFKRDLCSYCTIRRNSHKGDEFIENMCQDHFLCRRCRLFRFHCKSEFLCKCNRAYSDSEKEYLNTELERTCIICFNISRCLDDEKCADCDKNICKECVSIFLANNRKCNICSHRLCFICLNIIGLHFKPINDPQNPGTIQVSHLSCDLKIQN